MRVLIRGLEPSTGRQDYYELWLTKQGKLAAPCGRFTLHEGPYHRVAQRALRPPGLRRLGRDTPRLGSAAAVDQLSGLPELEAVSLGVDGPAETAELLLLHPVVDLGAGGPQLREHRVEVVTR